MHELGPAHPAPGQRPHRRDALRRRGDVLHADLQVDPGGEFRARRVPGARRLDLLVLHREMAAAVRGRLRGGARLHDAVRRAGAGRRAAPADRRADHLGDHGDDRLVDLHAGFDELGVRQQRRALPRRARLREGHDRRAQRRGGVSHELRPLARDHGRILLLLSLLTLRTGDARDRLQPAGRAKPRHLGEAGVRHGLGDLGTCVLLRRRGAGARQCGVELARHHWDQGVPGSHRRRPRLDRGRGGRRRHHRGPRESRRVRRRPVPAHRQYVRGRPFLCADRHPDDPSLRSVRDREYRTAVTRGC